MEDNPLLSGKGSILAFVGKGRKVKRHVHFASKGLASNTRNKSSKGDKSHLPSSKGVTSQINLK